MAEKNTFLTNENTDLGIQRGQVLSIDSILEAMDRTHALMGKFKEFDVDVFSLLGMRNLSAFVGEAFVAQLVLVSDGMFQKNPHQDG